MAEERENPQLKRIKTTIVGDSELPIHYVNIVNVRGGAEEFFVTLATAMPPEITDIKDLEGIDAVKAQAVFRFALSRPAMKEVIELMERIYNQQTKQIEMIRTLQENSGENEDE